MDRKLQHKLKTCILLHNAISQYAGRSENDAKNDAAKYCLKSVGEHVPYYKDEVIDRFIDLHCSFLIID